MNARQLLVNLVIVVVLLAIGGGIAYESFQSNNYVSTDNAQVTLPVVDVAALSAGTVQTVPVTVGERVTAGQILAQVVTAAAAAPAVAASRPTSAKSAATSATKGGSKASNRAGAATTGGGTAAAPAGALETITAPVTGVVSVVGVSSGETVLPGETLVEVTEPSQAVVVANVPETSIRDIEDGQAVDVWLDAYPGTTFKGHVQAIQPATQASLSLFPASALSGSFTKVTQLVPVWIAIHAQGNVLYNGLSAEVRIQIGNGSL